MAVREEEVHLLPHSVAVDIPLEGSVEEGEEFTEWMEPLPRVAVENSQQRIASEWSSSRQGCTTSSTGS